MNTPVLQYIKEVGAILFGKTLFIIIIRSKVWRITVCKGIELFLFAFEGEFFENIPKVCIPKLTAKNKFIGSINIFVYQF